MSEQILMIPIMQIIESPYQGRLLGSDENIRKVPDEGIQKLAESIRMNGQINPIIVRKLGENYELIDGHRRLESHRLLGMTEIKAIVRDMSEKEAQVTSVVANLLRKDLHNIERAFAFRKILDAGVFKDKRELSQAIGKDETYVGDLLQTLNMDKRIIDDLLKNKTTNDVRILRAIRKIEDIDENGRSDKQLELYNKFIKENLSRQEVFSMARVTKGSEHKAIDIRFTPRHIEIDLPRKYTKPERDMLLALLRNKLKEILPDVED